MEGFKLTTPDQTIVRFKYYNEEAPATVAGFDQLLPFTTIFMHARVSGQEIWTDNTPILNVIQENASVFTEPGEVVYGPQQPTRTKTANCMGIYYGEGKGLDCANIFAKVFDEDLQLMKQLGELIWKQGEQELLFEKI